MSMQSTTRESGNATGLPTGSLTRRSALRGSATAAAVALSLAALGGTPVIAQAAPVAVVSPASPDAALIAHADRLVALARRCEAAADRRAEIEDRVLRVCPGPEPLPRPNLFADMQIDDSSPTRRVITATKSPTYDVEQAAWERATAAAQATQERQEADMEARLGLPEVVRRYDRMTRRCDRWASELAAMKPETADGLAAKSSALLVLLGDDRTLISIELGARADLVLSLMADAVRLGAGGRA